MVPSDDTRDGLPVAVDDLPALLSRELDPSRPRLLEVRSARLDPDGSLLLGLARGPSRERWDVRYTVPPEDLRLLDAPSFVLTVRANLEEWLDTGRVDTPVLRAQRRPDPSEA